MSLINSINENDKEKITTISLSPYKFNEKILASKEKQFLIYGDICKLIN